MDIQARMQRKNQQAALRARRMNKTARRLLQDKIGVLESTFKKQERLIYKETKSIEHELRTSEKGSTVGLDKNVNIQTSEPQPPKHSTNTANKTCSQKCRFHLTNTQCRYFPCQDISTYHSIGYNVRAPTGSSADHGTSKTYIVQDGVTMDAREVICPRDEVPPSSRITPRNSIRDRERGLQQLVKEMKSKNNQQRPRAWAINYGDPVSRRQLMKPVIPQSEVELES